MLAEPHAYFEWKIRERPSPDAVAMVASYILRLAIEPWAAPSEPEERLSSRPDYEMRTASIAVPNEVPVWLMYRHYFSSKVVQIQAIIAV